MSKGFAILVVVLMLGSPIAANAQNNELRFFSEEGGSNCFLNYTELGVATVHVWLTGTAPSSAIQFTAYTPACWSGAVWLGDNIEAPFLPLADTHRQPMGLSVAFIACRQMPIYVGRINHIVSDLTAECCTYEPGPAQLDDRGQMDLWTVDCSGPAPFPGVIRTMTPVGLRINASPTCPCETALAVETKTWGQIKALYQ